MTAVGFITVVGSEQTAAAADLLLSSLRQFGGEMRSAPVWVFHAGSSEPGNHEFADRNVHQIQLEVEARLQGVPFAGKVSACAHAESLLAGEVDSLVWINPQALILQPPLAFRLVWPHSAALRPVHIKNIGSPMAEPLDPFWGTLYRALGADLPVRAVESFVDGQFIRPYFNTHLFAIDPSLGLLSSWLDHFGKLARDELFQTHFCPDELHQIFLHQALFSVLVTHRLEWHRIRMLPPDYSYPLHLHPNTPTHRQAAILDDLVCPVYEGTFDYPATLNGLPLSDRLASWLALSGAPQGED